MNRKLNPVILVGAVLLIAGVAVLAVLASRGGDSKPSTVRALVAQTDIAPGVSANSAALKVQDVPRGDVAPGSPTDQSQLAGKIALGKVAKGTVINALTFGVAGATTDAGVTLPTGKEAVGLELPFAPGALRYVVPGNKVTVWATPKSGSSTTPDGQPLISIHPAQAVLNDVTVLRSTPGVGDGTGQATTAGPGNIDLLLAVNRVESARLIAVQTSGATLYVTLSNTSQD